MCAKRFLIWAVLCPLILLVSCGKKADDATAPTRWGIITKSSYGRSMFLTRFTEPWNLTSTRMPSDI